MCSTFGIRDFPILNSVPVTRELNAMIYEEFPLDIQWGPKATEPAFIRDGPYANLGFLEYMASATSTTTLRFNSNSFNLISVQLCTPQHASLLRQDLQRDCSGEIIIGFKSQSSISENFLFLCIPLLMRAPTKLSVYLEALRLGHLDGKPTSLLSVLPSDKHFISYSTCLQQKTATKSLTTQARVFVFTEGLEYPADKFMDITRKITGSAVNNPVYLPTVQLPDGLIDKSQAMLFSVTTETDYKSLLRYSQYYPQGTPDSSTTRVDNLSSYKCVPLDPAQNVKNDTIVVDTESGELLSQILKEKKDDKEIKSSIITPAIVEKLMAYGIAFTLIFFIFLILVYIVSSMVTPNANDFFNILKQKLPEYGWSVFMSFFIGIACFILGTVITLAILKII